MCARVSERETRWTHHTPRATSLELEPTTSWPDTLLEVTFEGRVGWRQPQLNRRCWHPGSHPDQPWAGLVVCRGPGSPSSQDPEAEAGRLSQGHTWPG